MIENNLVACDDSLQKLLRASQLLYQHGYEASVLRHTGWPKMAQVLLNPLTLSNIIRFSKFFHRQNQEKIYDNITTIENKATSVTTYFKKVTTGNNVFIVSVIV